LLGIAIFSQVLDPTHPHPRTRARLQPCHKGSNSTIRVQPRDFFCDPRDGGFKRRGLRLPRRLRHQIQSCSRKRTAPRQSSRGQYQAPQHTMTFHRFHRVL
jgi:hypothetical protein